MVVKIAHGWNPQATWYIARYILGVLGFVLLARTEPSVVRAATMGSVALVGMASGGREKGVRALGVAVVYFAIAGER